MKISEKSEESESIRILQKFEEIVKDEIFDSVDSRGRKDRRGNKHEGAPLSECLSIENRKRCKKVSGEKRNNTRHGELALPAKRDGRKYLMTLRLARYDARGCGKRKREIVCGM